MRKADIIILFFFLPLSCFSQLMITTNGSATTLAQAIVGNGISISNAILGSGAGATGTFTYSGANLGLSTGIILTTGKATQAANPGIFFCNVINGANYSDPDVIAISSQAHFDATILEFDFTPICDTLKVTYVFGSEEYPRYIHQYNDAFGLFITGPNPLGGSYAGRNMATLPNGITPVSINTVNGGWPLGSGASNSAYYVDNYTTPNSDIGYDGYTVPISSVITVVPCQSYHMKIAVVDGGNGGYDSGVFLQANAFSCSGIPLTSTVSNSTCTNTGSATVSFTNYSGTPSYLWLPGGQTTATITNLIPGTYTCVVTFPGLCSPDTVQAVVQSISPSVTALASDTICIGSSFTLSAAGSGGTPPYSYFWTQGVSSVSATVNPIVTTSYTVTVRDANGCLTQPAEETITVRPPLQVLYNPVDSMCLGSSMPLSVVASGGDGSYVYAWSPSSGLSSTTLSNPQAAPDSTTLYHVVVSDGCGTPAYTASILVQILKAPVSIITADQVSGCAPFCVHFRDSGSNLCMSAIWDFGDGQRSPTCSDTVHCYMLPGKYDISRSLTNANGCRVSVTANQFITVYALPVPTFSYSPEPVFVSNPLVSFHNLAENTVSWEWNFGDTSIVRSTLSDPQHTYPDTGCYTVTLNVTSALGCKDSSRTLICVDEDFAIYVPTAFSPNDDGINDIFQPVSKGYITDKYEFSIFDRWGLQIFQSQNFTEGWNGHLHNGRYAAQQDIYVWKIVIYDELNKVHTLTGRVALIK